MVIFKKFLFLVTEPSLMKGRVVGFRFERVPFNTTSLIWSSVFWEMNRFFKWISMNLGLISMFSHTKNLLMVAMHLLFILHKTPFSYHWLDFLLIYIVSSALILLVFGSQSYLASSARGMRLLVLVLLSFKILNFMFFCCCLYENQVRFWVIVKQYVIMNHNNSFVVLFTKGV